MEYLEFPARPIKQTLKEGIVSIQLDISADKVSLDGLKMAMDKLCRIEIAIPDSAVQADMEAIFREPVGAPA